MEALLTLPEANKLYEDSINRGNLRLVHLEHPVVEYDEFVSTRCNSTTETIRYLISNNSHWESVEFPTKEIYQVSFKYDQDDNEDDPVHSMIICGFHVYQSYFRLYPLRRTEIPNLTDLLKDPHKNWFKLTGDPIYPKFPLRVQYTEPSEIDLTKIQSKYKGLV